MPEVARSLASPTVQPGSVSMFALSSVDWVPWTKR
jgi:hypothetical protein